MKQRSFTQNMLRLSSPGGLSQAFSRFLDTAIALNSDNDDPMFFRKILIDYSKQERYLLMETYYSLLMEMLTKGTGLRDVLGEFMERYIGTPVPVHDQKYYDMLPGLLKCKDPVTRLMDYDCNTGRRFLAAAKFNPNLRFYGTDTFLPFVRISLLNLCINGLYGEIAYCSAFNASILSIWSVDLNYKGKPVIREIPPEKSLICQKRNETLIPSSKYVFNF